MAKKRRGEQACRPDAWEHAQSAPRLTLRGCLGDAIRARRLQHDLRQRDLAERARVCLETVGRVERGQVNCTVDIVERLGMALGWDALTLFTAAAPAVTPAVRALLLSRAQALAACVDALDRKITDTEFEHPLGAAQARHP